MNFDVGIQKHKQIGDIWVLNKTEVSREQRDYFGIKHCFGESEKLSLKQNSIRERNFVHVPILKAVQNIFS